MAQFNFLTGNTATDVKISSYQKKNGEEGKVARVTIAENGSGKNEAPLFLEMTAFDGTAEFLAKYFPKGKGIEVQYKISNNNYTNKEGEKVYKYQFRILKISFPPRSGKKEEKDVPESEATAEPIVEPMEAEAAEVAAAEDEFFPFA